MLPAVLTIVAAARRRADSLGWLGGARVHGSRGTAGTIWDPVPIAAQPDRASERAAIYVARILEYRYRTAYRPGSFVVRV